MFLSTWGTKHVFLLTPIGEAASLKHLQREQSVAWQRLEAVLERVAFVAIEGGDRGRRYISIFYFGHLARIHFVGWSHTAYEL